MNVLETILVVLEAIASIALIVVVLLQSGKEAGLSGVLSGSSDSYLSKNKNAGLDHVLASRINEHKTMECFPWSLSFLPSDF